jgi:hypothetical protein
MNVNALIRKCRHCNEPAGSTGRCIKHNEAHKADQRRRFAERRSAGLCQCGAAPSAGFKVCDTCRARQKSIQRRKRETGNCIRCSLGNLAVAAGMCRKCWFKKIAGDCLGARGAALQPTAEALELLWEKQGGVCVYTGEALVPGSTASLDHRLPQSRGGDHSITNLQWVAFHVNIGKGNLTHDEFLELCARVVTHTQKGCK